MHHNFVAPQQFTFPLSFNTMFALLDIVNVVNLSSPTCLLSFDLFICSLSTKRIQYEVLLPTLKALNVMRPFYLYDFLQLYSPSRTLRSSSDTKRLCIPLIRLKSQALVTALSHIRLLFLGTVFPSPALRHSTSSKTVLNLI